MRPFVAVPVALLAPFAQAQQEPRAPEQERLVRVTVASVSERSIYLDQGRESGLQVGSLVRLFPPGVDSLEVEVRSVTATSARTELPPGASPPPVGTRGEVRVTVAAATPAGTLAPRPDVPAHPPWTRQEAPRAADQPLLVPTFGQRPDQRPATLDGRLFAFGQWNRDQAGDRSSEYVLMRTGLRADATNHFGQGERVRIAGELDSRHVQVADAPDQDDQNARLDLLSVAFGTEHWAPTGFEAGRFLSPHLPELGLVDGIEVVRRYRGGYRMGVGFGSYPLPFPARDSGDDLGLHAFFDYTADASRSFAFAVGAQKTWHRGEADRDLLLLRVEAAPADGFRLYGTAKVDYYTSSDTIKGAGVELTELLGSARWDGASAGTGLTVSHFGWPELKRAEYQYLPDDLVRDGAVDRASLNGYVRPSDRLRLQARFDRWQDQDYDGTSMGLDGDLRDPIGVGSNLGLSLFRTDGGYSSGPGARAVLRAPLGLGSWRAGYRWYSYDLTELVTGPESYTRQSAELGLSWPLGNHGDLDASLERWFGDREDAWAFGLYLQWRF